MFPTEPLEPDLQIRGPAVRRVIRFAEFELSDPPSRLLKDGEEFHLRPQVMRALLVLADSPGEVVTRAALREAIWKDLEHVEVERGIKTVVRELRRALGDDPREPKFIETVRGVGYRFVAPEQLREEPMIRASARPQRRRVRFWSAAAALVLVLGSIAVGVAVLTPEAPTLLLPRVRASESAVAFVSLCEKLTDELASELIDGYSGDLDLVHILAFPEELSMSPRIARYAVDAHVTLGETQDEIVLAMELIDRRDGTIKWMRTYELSPADAATWPAEGARDLVQAVLEASS